MSEPLDDLDAQVRRLDPDRWLTTRFIADPQARADVIALYAFDAELTRAPRAASNALAGEIRLTWWREVLDEIFGERAVRRHPVALALDGAVRRHGLPRQPLEAMIDARYDELGGAKLDAASAPGWADAVGGSAMALAAQILDPDSADGGVADAGRAFALSRAVVAQLVPHDAVRGALEAADRSARRARPSVAAFPAIMPLVLSRAPAEPDLVKRFRLVWAALRGRV
jgi:phytoene synthase